MDRGGGKNPKTKNLAIEKLYHPGKEAKIKRVKTQNKERCKRT